MKIAIQNDTQLISSDTSIAQAKNIFGEDEQQKLNEPVFYEMMNQMGIDADELERIAPDTKLENVLSPKAYKGWNNLSNSEKKRVLNRIYNTTDYKEYIQSLAEMQQKNKSGVDYSGQSLSHSFATKDGTKAISCGKKVTKRIARTFSEMPSNAVNSSLKEEDRTETNIYGKTSRSSAVVMKLIGKALIATGTPWLFLILAVIVLFLTITSFFLVQKKVSENAGIMPYYAQADYPTVPFNGNTIKSDGCGITSMAMVVSLFKNETITPPMLAEIANADASYNTVNSHRAINQFASRYELGAVEEMGGPERNCCQAKTFDLSYIQDKMQKGSPVIVSVSGGYYNPSGGGHYLALYGVGANGVIVYDAGSRTKYRASVENDGSAWGVVFENAKHIWIFEPYGGTYLTGSTNEESVYLNLKQAGYSDAAAAGIIGNMYQESSHGLPDLKLDAESSDGSIGLLQWTSGRRDALESLGRNRNKNWWELAVQIEYLFQELNSYSQWKWTSYAKKHYPASDDISLEEFKQLADPQLAAEIFQAKFVRPSYEKSNLSYRKEKAQEVYLKYVNNQ